MAALLGRFAFAGNSQPPDSAPAAPVVGNGAAVAVNKAQALLQQHPDDPRALTALGLAYLSRAKETADPSYYTLADRVLKRSSGIVPDDLRTMVGLGLLELSRHEFRSALALGLRTTAKYPDSAEALGVVVDAQVELGRYPAAVASAQAMVDRKPNIASLSRISYLRELYGDPAGAISALTEARTAGSGSASDIAYISVLLADLLRGQGRLGEANAAYNAALNSVPAYTPAQVGLARLDAARGNMAAAGRRLQVAVTTLPLPETVAFYGDVLAALHRPPAEAAQQYALVHAIEALQRANGVVVDLESARFEADHARDPGANPAAAVRLARLALANRPTIYGHDALGWALRQAGSPAAALPEANAALVLGTRDALLYYHRAAIEADLGMRAAAGRDLRTAFSISPALMSESALASIRDLPIARSLARKLGVPVPAVTG
jgi:tetratricopeptide (TPR) repeat protein